MTIVRSSPSGKLVLPLQTQPLPWDGLSPLAIELVPIGHSAGLYRIATSLSIIAAAAAGNLAFALAWDAPGFGPTSLPAANFMAATAAIPSNIAFTVVDSSGLAPIVITFTAPGLGGVLLTSLVSVATLDALPVESS